MSTEEEDEYIIPQPVLDEMWRAKTLLFNLSGDEKKKAEQEFINGIAKAASMRVVGKADQLPSEDRLASAPHNAHSLSAKIHAPIPWPLPNKDNLLTPTQLSNMHRDPMWPKFSNLIEDLGNFPSPPTIAGILKHAQHSFHLSLTVHLAALLRGPEDEVGVLVSFQIGTPGRYYVGLIFKAEDCHTTDEDMKYLDNYTTKNMRVNTMPFYMFKFTCQCKSLGSTKESS